jgi:hypothetical protein
VPLEDAVPVADGVWVLEAVEDTEADGVGDAATSTMEATLLVVENAPYSVLYSGPANATPTPPWYDDEKVNVCCDPLCVRHERKDVPPPASFMT